MFASLQLCDSELHESHNSVKQSYLYGRKSAVGTRAPSGKGAVHVPRHFSRSFYVAGAALALPGGVLALMAAGDGPFAGEPGAGLALVFAGVAIIGTVAALPNAGSAAAQTPAHAWFQRSRDDGEGAPERRRPWEEAAE